MNSVILPIHIAAGGLAIVLGAVALSVKKGGTIHRRSGLLFVCAMLVMGFTASILGLLKSPNDPNVTAGITISYFVLTALMTVRPVSRWTTVIHVVAVTVAVLFAYGSFLKGVTAFKNAGGSLNGVPFPMHFLFAAVFSLAAVGDLRSIRFGLPHGGSRLARHLWRMCFALFIAAGSFFSIRERVAKILPEPFTTAPMRTLPILLIFGAMFYWLWRVRRRDALPVVARHDGLPTPLSPSEFLPTDSTMNNLTANPFIRLALAGIAVWIASIFMAHGQNQPDELKKRILAQAESCSADDYAFTRKIHTEGRQNGKREQHVTVEKFDPTQAAEARWTLVSVDGAPPSAEALNEFRKATGKRRVPGYHRLASYFGSPASASSDARGRTVFRFGPLPGESVTVMNSDVSSNATAEALIGESNGVPFAEQLRISVRRMRLKLVMKLEKFESTARYRIGPEGKPLLVEQTTDMTGSGMGQEGGAHTVTTYSDYRLVSRQH